jgi:hypothetical protein
MGTRVRTNKPNKKGCRNKALGVVLLVPMLSLVLMGATECATKRETCEVTARDNTSVTLTCTNEKGEKRVDERGGINSDLYPNCQVGTYWPGCKGKGGTGGS